MRKIGLLIGSLMVGLLLFSQVLAYEDLTELEARTSRKSTNTFYSGEDAGNYYIWQPQTVIYRDTSTNHEMWLWSQTNNKATMGPRWGDGWEYNWQPWSADGKRIAFFQDVDVGCYTRGSGSPWFTARSDGSYWRPMCETVGRTAYNAARFYPDWSPIIPDVAYATGANTNGNSGLDQNGIYREVFTDTSITSTLIVDLIPGNTNTSRWGGLKDRITGDGLYLLEGNYLENEPYYVVQVEPAGSRQMKLSWNLPTLDTYWYSTVNPANGHAHDEGVVGNASEGYWFYFMPTGASVWWRISLWGSDSGAPDHTQDHTSPYDWWTGSASMTEVQVVGDEYGYFQGNHPAFASDSLWSHSSFDRWGTHVVYSDVEASPIGPACMDIDSYTRTGYNSNPGGNQYSSYTGWSDYFVGSGGSPANVMVATKYDSITAADHITVGETHSSVTGDFCNPGQSPDGTKMVLKSDWLSPTATVGNLFVGIVYFPYPPEITSCSATGGAVTVQFDWRHDQASPRTYTTRGWPDEDTDDPCPPRETEKFRLWRSSDNITWTPLSTATANIFSRYDFSNGTWQGNSFWRTTDTPGDGTFYYAITSVEWSGLESQTLSNVYKITVSGGSGSGSQNTAYPADPGGDSSFYATAPNEPIGVSFAHKESPATADGQYTIKWTRPANYTMVRYYNIYAEDGSTPAIEQQNRIASIPAGAGPNGSFSWVDWLGNPNGSTQYVVTSVDYQGNESGTISEGDDEAPTIPDGLSATAISSSQIDLSWEASTDNVGVAGYRIYRDGNYLGTSSSTQYSNTDLTPSTEYSYRVSAYDARGNESGQSSPASATTHESGSPETISVINIGDQWKYFKGGSDPGSGWNNVSFDYSSWLEGPTGIGYGDSDDATVLSDMRNNYLTVYTRKTFQITDPSSITAMTLNIDYDDGFVAYINGHEVARSNISGTPSYDSPASGWNEAGTPEAFDLTVYRNVLISGLNVLAIEIHNAEIASSDLSMIPSLTVVVDSDSIPPRDITNAHKIGFDGSNLELGWTNPTTYDEYGELIPENQDFEGVMIRYNVGSDAPYPANHTEGTLFVDFKPAYLDENNTYTEIMPAEEIYKFSFFSHDADGHYSTTVHLLVDAKLPLVNVPPIINSFTGIPASLNNPGETITLSAFATDPDGDSLTYTINFGDGTASESGSEVVHTYASAGIYTADVTVDDGHGNIVGESLQIAVNDVPPAKPTSVTVK